MTHRTLFAIAVLAASSPTFAAAPIDLAAIDRAVADFSGGAALPVDRRLRLNPCTAALALRWSGPRRESVIVACPDPGGWRLFVPVQGGVGEAADEPAISRGDAVTVAVTGAGFAVMQSGDALEAGAVGRWINVRLGQTPDKIRTIRAQVVRAGLVALPLP